MLIFLKNFSYSQRGIALLPAESVAQKAQLWSRCAIFVHFFSSVKRYSNPDRQTTVSISLATRPNLAPL